MKADLYTKAVLTVIAFMLVMIGCHQYVSPTTTVNAEGQFAGVQFTGPTPFSFFDTRTGQVWVYYPNGGTLKKYRLTGIGGALVEAK
jgi:uncharacterized membrane protein